MWLTEEWHHWAKRMSNSSHRMLALLFITYFPLPKTVFPSGFTSAALLKCNYLVANLQEKEKQWLLTRGAITVNVTLMPAEQPGTGNIQLERERWVTLVLCFSLGLIKRVDSGAVGNEWQTNAFQRFTTPRRSHKMLFKGVTEECVPAAAAGVRKQEQLLWKNFKGK